MKASRGRGQRKEGGMGVVVGFSSSPFSLTSVLTFSSGVTVLNNLKSFLLLLLLLSNLSYISSKVN